MDVRRAEAHAHSLDHILTTVHARHVGNHDGALASYIPQLAAVDPEPDHLFVQGAPWNLEALQRRRDIAAGLLQTLTDHGALELPDLARQ